MSSTKSRLTCLVLTPLLALAVLPACEPDGSGSFSGTPSPDASDTGDTAPADTADGSDASTLDAASPPCNATRPAALAGCVDQARLTADLTFIAAERPPASAHWQEVQDLCADTFTDLGFAVERQEFDVGTNVIGVLADPQASDELVVISAHYDHVGGCDGADDNASGVAGLLESARALADGSYERTLVFACWDQEEMGLLGSEAWAERAKQAGERVAGSFVYEMIGCFDDAPDSQEVPPGLGLLFPDELEWLEARDNRGDFLALITDEGAEDAARLLAGEAEGAGLPSLVIPLTAEMLANPLMGDMFRSDHASFWRAGYSAMMITDTANFRNPYYHCGAGPDSVDTLDPARMALVVRATVAAAAQRAGLR